MNFFKRLILPKQEFVIFLGEEYTEVYINNGNNNHVQLVQPGKTQWHHEVFTPLNPNNAREDSTGKLAEEKQNVKTAVLDALIQIGNANMSEEDMGTDQTVAPKYLLDFDKLERSDESSRWSIMKKTEVKLKCYEASRSFLMPNAPSSVVLKLFNQNETLPDFIFTHEISTLKEKNGLEIKIPRNLFDSLNKKLYKNCIKEVQQFLEAGNTKWDRITDFTLVNFGLENRLTMQISKLLKKDIQIIKLDLVPGNTDIIRTALSICDLQERNILKMNENSDEVMIPSVDSDSTDMTSETTVPREEVLRLATKIYLGLMEIKIPQSKSVRLSTKHKYHKQFVESTLATLKNGMLAPIHEDVLAKIQWRLNESYFQNYVLDQEEIQHLKVKELIDNCPSHSTSSLSDEDSMHKNGRTHRASFNDEPKSLVLKVSNRTERTQLLRQAAITYREHMSKILKTDDYVPTQKLNEYHGEALKSTLLSMQIWQPDILESELASKVTKSLKSAFTSYVIKNTAKKPETFVPPNSENPSSSSCDSASVSQTMQPASLSIAELEILSTAEPESLSTTESTTITSTNILTLEPRLPATQAQIISAATESAWPSANDQSSFPSNWVSSNSLNETTSISFDGVSTLSMNGSRTSSPKELSNSLPNDSSVSLVHESTSITSKESFLTYSTAQELKSSFTKPIPTPEIVSKISTPSVTAPEVSPKISPATQGPPKLTVSVDAGTISTPETTTPLFPIDFHRQYAIINYREYMTKRVTSRPEFLSQTVMQQYHKCGVQYSLDIFSKIDNLTELRTFLVEEVLKQEFQIFDTINAFRKNSSANSIGVDLGTTYCCVAVHRNNRTEVIPNTMGKYTTPSYVALHDDQPFVGEVAKSRAHEHPQSTLFDMKRMLGKRIYDLNILQSKKYWPFDITEKDGQVKLKCGPEKMFKPEDVIAMLVSYLKTCASDFLGEDVVNAVVSVPADFNTTQKDLTREACNKSGLNVLHLVSEPTCAALAHSILNMNQNMNCLVFDLGGGTFDVAVLEIQGNCIKIRAIDGDPNIGGEDFDNEMVQHCIQEFMKEHGIDLGIRQCNEDSSALARRLRRLKSHCEEQKCNLSATKHVVVSIDGIIGSLDLKVAFSRELFSSLIESYLRTCMSIVDRAIFSSEVKYGDITQIVMVGGSSRIPKVQEMLEQRFGRKALCKQVNADEAVAAGAAILASYFDEPSKSRITTEELEMVLLN